MVLAAVAGSAQKDKLLAIYLEDHLAGSTAGVELARRLRSSNERDPEFAEPLARLCREVEEDRATLTSLMARLDVGPSRVKNAAALAGERLGRLKLNGQLTGYSPLSRLLELEAMGALVTGKLRLWRALEHSQGERPAGFDVEHLAARAEDQVARLEDLHRRAAQRALPAGAAAVR